MKYYICDDNTFFEEDLACKIVNIDPAAETEIFPTLASLIFRMEDGDHPDAVFLDIVNADGSGKCSVRHVAEGAVRPSGI